MKGLSPIEYAKILDFIKEHHGFYKYPSAADSYKGLGIKYVDSCYDSRFGDIWSVTLRGGFGPELSFTTNHYRDTDTLIEGWFHSLYEWLMAYLTHKWQPTDVDLQKMMSIDAYEVDKNGDPVTPQEKQIEKFVRMGLKKFVIDNVEIWASNKKAALRKRQKIRNL